MALEVERCISCGGVLLDDDDVYSDVDGGVIHARCCGPEGYVGTGGEPLKPGDQIPAPWKYASLV